MLFVYPVVYQQFTLTHGLSCFNVSFSTVIVVGYIQTAVTLFESDGVAQLTVAITTPSQTYEIRSSFFLLVNTINGTATGLQWSHFMYP